MQDASELSVSEEQASIINEVEADFFEWSQKDDHEPIEPLEPIQHIQQQKQTVDKPRSQPSEDQHELSALNMQMLTANPTIAYPREQTQRQRQECSQSFQWCRLRVLQGYFPPLQQPYKYLKSPQQLKAFLTKDQQMYNKTDIHFRFRCQKKKFNKGLYITIMCMCCRMSTGEYGKKKMAFSRRANSNVLHLTFFDNTHDHEAYDNSRSKEKFKQIIIEQMQKQPQDMPYSDFLALMQHKHGTNCKNVRWIMKRFRDSKQTYKHIKKSASQTDASFWFKNQLSQPYFRPAQSYESIISQPQLFLFAYNSMRQRFKAVGNVCYLMMFQTKLIGNDEDKDWKLIAITGLSLAYIMEPFAFALIQNEGFNMKNVAQIVKHFLQWFGKIPQTIITPLQPRYTQVIEILRTTMKYNGLHLFDPIYECQRLSAIPQLQKDLAYFRAILISRTKYQYKQNLKKAMVNCKPNAEVRKALNRIVKYADKMIFGCTIFDYSANKMVTEIVNQWFVYKKKAATKKQPQPTPTEPCLDNESLAADLPKKPRQIRFTHSFLSNTNNEVNYVRFLNQLMIRMHRSITPIENSSQYDLKPYEHVVEIPEIVAIRKCLKINLFSIFGQEYGKTYHLEYNEREGREKEMRVFDVYDRMAKCLYVVAPFPSYKEDSSLDKITMRCNCLFNSKCGLPCTHEILATMLTKSSMVSLFRNDFLVSQRYKPQGRPKKTNRNKDK